jgi:hypothetical protein
VKWNNQTGWMINLMLDASQPIEMSADKQLATEDLSQRARRRPSSFASTAAARGDRTIFNYDLHSPSGMKVRERFYEMVSR